MAYVLFAMSGGLQDVQVALENWAVNNLAPSIGDQVVSYLRTIQDRVDPKAIGIFGVLAFIWSGLNMMSRVEEALNGVWGLGHRRPFFKRLWLYPLSLIIAPAALGASFVATSFIASKTAGNDALSAALLIPMTIVPWLITAFLFSFIYWVLPFTIVSKKAALKAGLITGVAFELLKQAYAIYAANTIGHSIYGSLAALPILFVWISLSCTVFMLGAELCYFFDMREQGVVHVARRESHLSFPLLVDILHIFQQAGRPITVKEVVRLMKWDQSDIFRHVHYLADVRLIRVPKGRSRGSERYQAVELNFEAALERLLKTTNEVKYEQLELPKFDEPLKQLDRVWSSWGARRKPHPTV